MSEEKSDDVGTEGEEGIEREEGFDKKEEEIGKLEEILEKKEERIQELENLVKKVRADFENYKKKRKKEEDRIKERAKQDMLKRFLDPLDGLRSASDLDVLDNVDDFKDREKEELETVTRGLYEGIENVINQFERILGDHGIEVIDPEGEEFDPKEHEAVSVQETSEEEDNSIAEVLQIGYKGENRVIRPARVIVYKRKTQE